MFAEPLDPKYNLDAVEGKLFGIGSESYVVGSHEFYLGYAIARKKLVTLDAGHFHPTEMIADKISSALTFLDEILLHVSRGVRWDSDHVVMLDDQLLGIAEEIVRGGYLNRTHIGLDYFDASINRVAAWAIGIRNMLQALLLALVEPIDDPAQAGSGQRFHLAAGAAGRDQDAAAGAVWDYYCLRRACRSARPGSTRSSGTRRTCCRSAAESVPTNLDTLDPGGMPTSSWACLLPQASRKNMPTKTWACHPDHSGFLHSLA